jgi:hypothetical protein
LQELACFCSSKSANYTNLARNAIKASLNSAIKAKNAKKISPANFTNLFSIFSKI